MQIIIMAAGKGSRLKEISKGLPKGLVELNEKPIIDRLLKTFKNIDKSGFKIVVGFKQHLYRKHLKNKKIEFISNPFYDSGQVLSSFWFALPFIDIKEDIIFCHADTLFEEPILKKVIKKKGDIVMAVSKTEVDDEAMKVEL
jgi:choline kinase